MPFTTPDIWCLKYGATSSSERPSSDGNVPWRGPRALLSQALPFSPQRFPSQLRPRPLGLGPDRGEVLPSWGLSLPGPPGTASRAQCELETKVPGARKVPGPQPRSWLCTSLGRLTSGVVTSPLSLASVLFESERF